MNDYGMNYDLFTPETEAGEVEYKKAIAEMDEVIKTYVSSACGPADAEAYKNSVYAWQAEYDFLGAEDTAVLEAIGFMLEKALTT